MLNIKYFQQHSIKKSLIFNGLLIFLFAYFVFHATYGSRGILAYFNLNAQLEKSLRDLSQLKTEKAELTNQVELLRPETLDQDMLDEVARKNLGVAKESELVFITGK